MTGENSIPSVVQGWSQQIDISHYLIGTSKGVYQVEVNINGKVIKSIPLPTSGDNSIPIPTQGWSQKINDAYYLVGTSKGVYEVKVDTNGLVVATEQVPMIGPISIPNPINGFSQQINEAHYLIRTNSDGLYQVEVNPINGTVVKTEQIPMSRGESTLFIPDVGWGWIQKIDDNHYLVATKGKDDQKPWIFPHGIFEVEVNSNGVVTKATSINWTGTAGVPFVKNGWAQKIDKTHFLIGTTSQGVYQVELDLNTERIVKKSIQVPMWGKNSIPSVMNGWSQQIDVTHYLIATEGDGVYQVEVDFKGMVVKSTLVPRTGNNSIVSGERWTQRIDSNHYLIGSANGVYEITTGQ